MVPVGVSLFFLCLIQDALPKMYGEKTAEIACNFKKLGPLFIIPSVTFRACSKFALNHLKPQLSMTDCCCGRLYCGTFSSVPFGPARCSWCRAGGWPSWLGHSA
ncbi:multidrug resistance protein, MATE family [Trypanosoma rangeli]|uniref:Multidrug resistance protein, MATE family n=1 Tax=Trypanosoma rangeli TaxID=5698 RepID=A0A3R7KKK5_TRYRA|nr:multidrug resistance protein, MATE family [Trypanosoma rangeli]RNE96304.1 multidrug resistance protein, MATE family [Trypanosoma rangeli]|eukprot:RNE96304.1 multidrug resistance protein, MATE family [Trypanosoma rangeli]